MKPLLIFIGLWVSAALSIVPIAYAKIEYVPLIVIGFAVYSFVVLNYKPKKRGRVSGTYSQTVTSDGIIDLHNY